MASQGPPVSYRPGVNRAVTKKWAEAKAINYDDWDDDDDDEYDEPTRAGPGHGSQPSWGGSSQGYSNPQNQHYPSNRSVTNPSPSRSAGRTSFDRGDERRHFSSNAAGFEGPYPTAQRAPFEEPRHDFDPKLEQQMRAHRPQPPLQLQTPGGRPSMEQGHYQPGPFTAGPPGRPSIEQGHYQQGPFSAVPVGRPSMEQGQYHPGPFNAGPRGNQYSEPRAGPFPAPIGPPGRRSHSSGRPTPSEMVPRHESPIKPDTQNSRGNSPQRSFPPRKSSLSQQQPPSDFIPPAVTETIVPTADTTGSGETKALPFIRPADIYKRMEEERDKERRSQESSRPSFESATSRIRDTSHAGSEDHERSSDMKLGGANADDIDEPGPPKPTLDPIIERKSEYGFDNLLKQAGPDHPSSIPIRSDSKMSEPSSDYDNKTDPISASTEQSRQQSPFEASSGSANFVSPASSHPRGPYALPAIRGVSDFGSDMFGQRGDQQTYSQAGPIAQQTNPSAGILRHQVSHGYRSMVEQAFDESQNQVPHTPVSATDTLARSNSASASDISPIVGRGNALLDTQPTIPEESISNPTALATQETPHVTSTEKELPPPPSIVPGYRRDSLPPSPSNNPAKRPLSVTTADVPPAELANLSTVTPTTTARDTKSGGSTSTVVPFVNKAVATNKMSPSEAPAGNLDTSPVMERSTSEDWKDWNAQRKQFNTKMGVQDSNPTTPGLPSPVSRAESPTKGTVRDIAGKMENRSGRSSPQLNELARPSNARLESFRPSLPGGWQSYTTNATNTGTATPHNDALENAPQPISKTEDEDIPIAGPFHRGNSVTSKSVAESTTAFAAAAAAGVALTGAFSGYTHQTEPHHEKEAQDLSESEDEWNSSTSASQHERHTNETHTDHQDVGAESHDPGLLPEPSPLPPTPLPKDSPIEADASKSTLEYFPAPLRTSRTNEMTGASPRPLSEHTATPVRPLAHTAMSTETSPQDVESDRLRKEIVKSLTPKSSRVDSDHAMLSPAQPTLPATSGSQRTVSTMAESVLPREYDSYWNETEAQEPNPQPDVTPQTSLQNTKEVSKVDIFDTEEPKKTTLDQRFSWETAGATTPLPSIPLRTDSRENPGSPETIRAATLSEPLSSSQALRPAPSVKMTESETTPQISDKTDSATPFQGAAPIPQSGSFKELPFRDILALGSSKERTQAYNQHRQHLVSSGDGGLGNWLQSVGGGSTEHAGLMSSNGQLTTQQRKDMEARPSPARPKFRMASETFSSKSGASGTKQIQEDGKKLLQVAGKFGGKAGVSAKGLLAKGKDKFRTVSSSDKGILQSRRRSSQLANEPIAEIQHSSYPSAPPQIPARDISPVEDDDWSLPYSPKKNAEQASTGTGDRDVASTAVSRPTSDTTDLTPAPTADTVPARSTASAAPTTPIGHVISSHEESDLAHNVNEDATKVGDETRNSKRSSASHSQTNLAESSSANEHSHSHLPVVATAVAVASAPLLVAAAPTDHTPNAAALDSRDSNNLAAPDRRSMVSNISSPSPGPAGSGEGNRSRSISPAPNSNRVSGTDAPPYTTAQTETSKEEEAEQERKIQAETAPQADEQLPTYESPTRKDNTVSRLGPNPEIVPVSDLSAQRRYEGRPVQSRPFSFADSLDRPAREALMRANGQALDQQQIPSTLALQKERSNVSIEEVQDESSDPTKARRSYSRPFGVEAEPNVQDHPAFRRSIDRSQMYSTESPLPSARRQQGSSPVNRQQNIIPNQGEEGYRIPGPYVQQYRSPNKATGPFTSRTSPSQQMTGSPNNNQMPVDNFKQGPPLRSMTGPTTDHMGPPRSTMGPAAGNMGPPPSREGDRSKQRTFGGLFRSRSKSRSRSSPQDSLPVDNRAGKNKNEKRNSIFRANSRHDSISSHGSRHGSREQTPSREHDTGSGGQRRLSRDLLRRGSSGVPEDEGGKKKRFSGIGGFFGKSGNKGSSMVQHHQNAQISTIATQDPPIQQVQRASTMQPTASGRPFQEQPYHQQTTSPQGSYYQSQGQFGKQGQGTAPRPNGYYGSPDRQQHPSSAFPHGPDSFGRVRPISGEQGRSISQVPQSGMGSNQQQSGIGGPPLDQRPSQLRINTTPNSSAFLGSVPASAPPMPIQNLNPSYNHNFPTTRAPGSASSGTPLTPRAADLHKRSRSPKLGRRNSSEDLTQRYNNDPASQLGTFSSNKSRSPHTADQEDAAQEKPWRIDLPAAEEGKNNARAVQPLQRSESAANRGVVAELQGSKAEGYESEEEIPMSATAYPGQQWMPDAMDLGYGRWDD